MKHWTYYRWKEIQEKANWVEMISMGPGYSEFEGNMGSAYENTQDDFDYWTPSNRLKWIGHKQPLPTLYEHNLELALIDCCTVLNSAHSEWIHLDEYSLCLAYANRYNVDAIELYAEVYERRKNH